MTEATPVGGNESSPGLLSVCGSHVRQKHPRGGLNSIQVSLSGEPNTFVIDLAGGEKFVFDYANHRQIGRRDLEAGGQLFARIEHERIVVVEATGPRGSDRRTRTSYVPNRAAERAEITDRHAAGLHFVGDWHTHPDRVPQPSARDLGSMAECFDKSAHQLNGFILVIVGQAADPAELHVSVHDGSGNYRLMPRPCA